MDYKYDNLLIIGNGFDRCLGLKTTYKDFVDSSEWEAMHKRRKREYPQPSLVDYLLEKRYSENWFDMEQSMLDYVSRRSDGTFISYKQADKEDFYEICTALIYYLANLFKKDEVVTSIKMYESAAGEILRRIFHPILQNRINKLYSFNFTPLEIIYGVVGDGPTTGLIQTIHGEIKSDTFFSGKPGNNSIIMGISVNDINDIAPGYSFMIKSNNPGYKPTNITSDLMISRNVIIFGHSLNQMDFGYFEKYFKMIVASIFKNERTLTIITYDDSSKIAILDNIKKAGISVRELFAHTLVKFILTSKYKDNNADDQKHFDELIRKF